MDPLTASFGILGIIGGIAGTVGGIATGEKEAGIASKEYQVGGQVAQLQMQENEYRRQAMELNASRQQTQILRTTQQASAMALAAGVGKTGSTQSSGIQGGIAQTKAEGAYNQAGIQQNLGIGENIFNVTGQIDAKKILLSQLQSEQANLQGTADIFGGIASLGFGLAGSAGQLGQIGGYLGGLFGGGTGGSAQGPGMPQMGYIYNQ